MRAEEVVMYFFKRIIIKLKLNKTKPKHKHVYMKLLIYIVLHVFEIFSHVKTLTRMARILARSFGRLGFFFNVTVWSPTLCPVLFKG